MLPDRAYAGSAMVSVDTLGPTDLALRSDYLDGAGHPFGGKRQIGEISSGDGGRWLGERCGRWTGWDAAGNQSRAEFHDDKERPRRQRRAVIFPWMPVTRPSRPASKSVGGCKLRASATSVTTAGPDGA